MIELSDGRKFSYELELGGKKVSAKDITKQFKQFSYRMNLDGNEVAGIGDRGDYCVWLPLNDEIGFKLILPCDKFSLDDLYANVSYIKDIDSQVFPKIYSITKTDKLLIVELERIHGLGKSKKLDGFHKKWLGSDAVTVEKLLENNLNDLTRAVHEITKYKLCPEDEWYKSTNMIGGKIIDFHWFYKMPQRYNVPSKISADELSSIYNNALKRYKARGDNKWKGRIYQGYHFDNNYSMEGYSSDGKLYDSYLKLPFSYMSKSENASVLDIGSNEGFFSIQSYLHGAKRVVGLDLTKEDVDLANEIKAAVGAEAVEFLNDDAIKYTLKTKEEWNVVIMNSVLHQVYKNMEGSDELLSAIAKKAKYFVYETPVKHPLMNIPLEVIVEKLKKYFKIVRLIYVYNAYSTGYRANFVCYTFK